MKNLYLLYWSPNLGQTYGFGAEIEFFRGDGSVRFANRLTMPGRAIFTWPHVSKKPGREPHVQLPFLDPEKTYAFSVNGTIIPRDSVGVEVEYFDSDGNFIGRDVTEGREDTMEFPPDAIDYAMNLVSFGNQSLIFRNLVLGERDTLEDYQLTLDDNQPMITLDPTDKSETAPIEIQLIKRQRPILPLEFKPSTTTIIVLPPDGLLESEEELSRFATRVVMNLISRFNRERLLSAQIVSKNVVFDSIVDVLESRLTGALSTRIDDL